MFTIGVRMCISESVYTRCFHHLKQHAIPFDTMSGFPKVPRIRGDTDDEASIHLYSQVGPANPLHRRAPSGLGPKSNYERDIMKILYEEDDKLEPNGEPSAGELPNFNTGFHQFQKLRSLADNADFASDEEDEVDEDKDYTDDETVLDDDAGPLKLNDPFLDEPKPNDSLFQQFQRVRDNESEPKAKQNSTGKPKSRKNKSAGSSIWIILSAIIVFLASFSIGNTLPPYITGTSSPSSRPIESFKDITSRFQKIEKHLDQLDGLTANLSEKQEFQTSKFESLEANLNKKFTVISKRFDELAVKSEGNENYHRLWNEFNELKERIELLSLSDPDLLGSKLKEIANQLTRLSLLSTNLENVKSDILQQLMDALPNQVPVYIKNNKIHYLPEFQKYLYSFVEKFYRDRLSNETVDWNTFIKQNDLQLKNYINSNLRSINKASLQEILNTKLQDNNKVIWKKVNEILDSINTIPSNSTITKASSKVLLSNLLDVLHGGSVNVNYANYRYGTRILGFLTDNGHDFGKKSLSRRLFLGWYDYLTSNGLKSPKYWKFNANNVILDGGSYWQCELNSCNFGLRLFSPVILTDFVLENPLGVEHVDGPLTVSIYIRPKNASQRGTLLEYLKNYKLNFEPLNTKNKYLKKFVKVKEVGLNSEKPINHIKFPVSLVNLRISVRDIYVELVSMDGKIGLYQFKAYGISEYNAEKYSDEVETLLNKMYDQQQEIDEWEEEERIFEAYTTQDVFDDSQVLGADEILL